MDLSFSHYGEERLTNATELEIETYNEIVKALDGIDTPAPIRLTRKSDDYVTVAIGEWDLARIKFTTRAAWIVLPCVGGKATKRKLNNPSDILDHKDDILESINVITRYWSK